MVTGWTDHGDHALVHIARGQMTSWALTWQTKVGLETQTHYVEANCRTLYTHQQYNVAYLPLQCAMQYR